MSEQAEAINEENDDLVMKRMGVVRFYLMPWLRQAERDRYGINSTFYYYFHVCLSVRLKKIAAIEEQMDFEMNLKSDAPIPAS